MTTTFENNLLDLVTAVVMAPVAALYGLVCLIWQGCVLLWRCRQPIAWAGAVVGAVGLCWACPLLPLGLAIVVIVGYVTWPRSAVRA